jgi:predicted TIM-barrel fold metal-dependent hydrolase
MTSVFRIALCHPASRDVRTAQTMSSNAELDLLRFPYLTQEPMSDRRYYCGYQMCVDLDLPIVVNAGIARLRVPSECEHVTHFDQACYDFPDLRIVMRQGAELWEDLAVKLMVK